MSAPLEIPTEGVAVRNHGTSSVTFCGVEFAGEEDTLVEVELLQLLIDLGYMSETSRLANHLEIIIIPEEE